MAQEKPSFEDDMRDNGYRFAHDLMTVVIKRSGKYVPYIKVPDPGNFLFTDVHRRTIEEFLALEGEYIENLVIDYAKRFTVLNYSDVNYLENRDIVVAKFVPEPYSEEEFVKLCAAIAQVAACIFRRNEKCNVTVYAMNDVHSLVKEVLSRGTLQHSFLRKDISALLATKNRIKENIGNE